MANNKFRNLAIQNLSASAIMVGREQVKTEEVVGKPLTIVGFDFATITDAGEEKVFPVVVFEELPGKYYNGGSLMMKLCKAWAESCGGDPETASFELSREGGVQVMFRETRTKTGNNLVCIDIL